MLCSTVQRSRSYAVLVPSSGLLEEQAQGAESLVERLSEQVLLARHVVVDRRLRDAQLPGDVLHARGVVAALVEDLDRLADDGVVVVPGAAAPPHSVHGVLIGVLTGVLMRRSRR